jgi:hypothetical protein
VNAAQRQFDHRNGNLNRGNGQGRGRGHWVMPIGATFFTGNPLSAESKQGQMSGIAIGRNNTTDNTFTIKADPVTKSSRPNEDLSTTNNVRVLIQPSQKVDIIYLLFIFIYFFIFFKSLITHKQ